MLPSTTPRRAHTFGVDPTYDIAANGDLLVRTLSLKTTRARIVAQTFRTDSLAQGIDPKAEHDRSIAAVDAHGRLLWCRMEPEGGALSPDGAELAHPWKRSVVRMPIPHGEPSLRRLAFEPKGLIYDASGDWIYLHDDDGFVYRCPRHDDAEPEVLFRESSIAQLAFADDAAVIFRSHRELGVYDLHWKCVRQWMSCKLGFATDIVLRRAGRSILAFNAGHGHIELHDPWWGSRQTLPMSTVRDAEASDTELHVLVGDDTHMVETWRDGELVGAVPADVPTLWHWRNALARAPISAARCEVAFVDDQVCLFGGQHLRALADIEEVLPIGAVAQFGSELYVAARHVIAAHHRGRRRALAQTHDEAITALAVCRDHLVSVSVNGKAFVWTPEGARAAERRHPKAIWDVASRDGKLVTVGDEGIVRVYRDPIASEAYDAYRLGVCHAAGACTNLIAVASRELVTMMSWRGEETWRVRGHVGSIAAHPHDDLFALGTSTGEVVLARPGEQREVSLGHTPSPSLAFSPDGRRLLVGSGNPAHPGAALELELS